MLLKKEKEKTMMAKSKTPMDKAVRKDKKEKEVYIMAKLCPRGKAAAKRKFKVYPSAYANMYASAVCSGKVTPGGKKNRKKKMGGGMAQRGLGRAFMKYNGSKRSFQRNI